MEFETASLIIHQENHSSKHQISHNDFTLFEKNLHRINENLKYVNQYYTSNYEQPDENLCKALETNELSELKEPFDEEIDQSLIFYNDFYKIAMNEIESIRKTDVRNILTEKLNTWECKRKEYSNKLKSKNEGFMQKISEELAIDKNYVKLLDKNDNELQIRLHKEKIKIEQKAKSIKFFLALKIASSLIDDAKINLSELSNNIPPKLHCDYMQNLKDFDENLNKFKNMIHNSDGNNLRALNQYIQNIQIFREQLLKYVPNKSSEIENFSFVSKDSQNNQIIPLKNKSVEAQHFKFVVDDNLEVKSNDLVTFKFKTDEEKATCESDISNFSFAIESSELGDIQNNKCHSSEDPYKQILENYLILKKNLEQTENSYRLFLNDESLKSLRQELKKSINTPVNSISSVSSWHMSDKFVRLDSLLRCKTVKTGNSEVSANCHKDALIFCKDTLAQKVINIGEQVASVKAETAFEVSSVITELWLAHPDFGLLLYTRFKLKCPWLIPQYVAKTEGITDEEYYKSLGYNYTDGVVEKQDKYVKRMTGIIRLFASIIVTETKHGKALGIGQAWMLIAATVNLNPQFDITAVLLHEMLLITGYYLKQAYGQQFIKMLKYINNKYIKKIDEVTPIGCGGPVQRLKTFISKVIQVGHIDKPKGIIPYNFW